MRSKIVFLILFLLLTSSFGILAPLPRAHAFSGGAVCIQAALPSTTQPTSCPSTPPTIIIPSTIKSTFALEVDVYNSSALNGFDIAVQSDPAVAKPLTANTTGSIINNLPGSFGLLPLVNCVNNGVPPYSNMNCVPSVDAVGVAHIGIASLGGLSNPPTTGRLMYINYNVTGTSTSSPVIYPSSATQCASSSSPNFCVTISGTTGASVPETIVTANFLNLADFTLTASPTSLTIIQGLSSTSTITVEGLGSTTHTVDLTASVLPVVGGDPQAFLNPTSVMLSSTVNSGTSTITVSTSATTPVGPYTVTVTGFNGTIQHMTKITLSVTSATTPDFGLGISGPTAVRQGRTINLTVTASSQGGFGGLVTLNETVKPVYPSPQNMTLTFTPKSGTLVTTSFNSTLTVKTGAQTPTEQYKVTITGNATITGKPVKHTLNFTLVVASTLPLPKANFTWFPPIASENQPVALDASHSQVPAPTNITIVLYAWDFGDTNSMTTPSGTLFHQYNKFGNYTVKLTVTDSAANSSSITAHIIVNALPVATFTASQTNPFVGETVTFNAASSTDPDSALPPAGLNDSIASYAWVFGDGPLPTLLTTPVTTHVYGIVGSYDVFLLIADKFGGVSLSKTTTVKVDEPGIQLVSASLSVNTTTIGKAVTLTVNLLNNGTTSLSFRLEMTVNNITVAEQNVTLQPGRNTSPAITLSWDTTGYKPGIFLVQVRLLGTTANGRPISSLGQHLPAAGTVTLNTAPSQAFTLPGGNILWIAIAVIVIVGAALTFLLARRRRIVEA